MAWRMHVSKAGERKSRMMRKKGAFQYKMLRDISHASNSSPLPCTCKWENNHEVRSIVPGPCHERLQMKIPTYSYGVR